MSEGFQAGDTVQLKSGGPRMTIETISKRFESDQHNSAICVWFEKNKRMTDWFRLETLKKVEDTQSGSGYYASPAAPII